VTALCNQPRSFCFECRWWPVTLLVCQGKLIVQRHVSSSHQKLSRCIEFRTCSFLVMLRVHHFQSYFVFACLSLCRDRPGQLGEWLDVWVQNAALQVTAQLDWKVGYVNPLNFAEMWTGYTWPSRSNLHF